MRIGGTTANSTWEPASTLPSELITEYEEGVQRKLMDDKYFSGGETVHTLSSAPITHSVKRPRIENPSVMNTGYVIL